MFFSDHEPVPDPSSIVSLDGDIRRIDRDLNGPNDYYMARYDAATGTCIHIDDIALPNDVRTVPLPQSNPFKYEKVLQVLQRLHYSDEATLDDMMSGMSSYTGRELSFDSFQSVIRKWGSTDTLQVVRFIAGLALKINEPSYRRIPLLTKNSNSSLTLSQQQAAVLLANGFFCTFDDGVRFSLGIYNRFDFEKILDSTWSRNAHKLKCLLAYFRMIQMKNCNGVITILRQTCPPIRFYELNPQFVDVDVDDTGCIEDRKDHCHVDFANKLIGGGVLGEGTAQEEICFITAPENIIACLVCEQMTEKEAILIVGTQRYAKYEGYSNCFRFASPVEPEQFVNRSPLGHYPSCVIAIDAAEYFTPKQQYARELIERELRKAFVGFAVRLPNELPRIATGGWGCGVFRGNNELKFLIQYLAASMAGRPLNYSTFDAEYFAQRLRNFIRFIRDNNFTFDFVYNSLGQSVIRSDVCLEDGPFYYVSACRKNDLIRKHNLTADEREELPLFGGYYELDDY